MLIVILWWLLVVHVIGATILPVVFRFFHPFADRGFGLAFPTGIVLFGMISWWCGVTSLVPNSALTSVVIILATGATVWVRAWSRRGELLSFWQRRSGLLLTLEAIFLATFLGSLWIRSFNGEIAGTEKFMDFAFINAVARSESFPPIDPWLAPSSTTTDPTINYYYFGYLVCGLLIQLTGVAPSEGFNLSLSLIFAMTATGLASIGYTLTRDQVAYWDRDPQTEARPTPLPGGSWSFETARPYVVVACATIFAVLLSGNLWTALRRLDGSGVWEKDFWSGVGWNATRVLVQRDGNRDLDYTINEFPAFSFLLGDLHPHVLTLPLAVLVLSIAYRWFVDPPALFRHRIRSQEIGDPLTEDQAEYQPDKHWIHRVREIVPTCVLLGVLYISNSWDFPTYFVIAVGSGIVGGFRLDRLEYSEITLARIIRRALISFMVTGAIALVGIWPFVTSFVPPLVAKPGELPLGLVARRSDLWQFMEFWGLQLSALIPALGLGAVGLTGGSRSQRVFVVVIGMVALGVTVVALELRSIGTYGLALLLALLVLCVCATIISRPSPATDTDPFLDDVSRGGRAVVFAFGLVGSALMLLAVCEVVYIRDFYGGSLVRMNTVFKLYYQSWLLLGIAVPQLIFWALRVVSRASNRSLHDRVLVRPIVWTTPTLFVAGWTSLIVLCATAYPVHAAWLRTGQFSGSGSIDGFDWMRRFHPDDFAASRWLLTHGIAKSGTRAPVILEASGGAYSEFARMSTQTGFPTLLGWDQHERLWRGERINAEVDRRKADIDRFYRASSDEEARSVLQEYAVAFVVFGYLEQQMYGLAPLERLDSPQSQLDPVFRTGSTVIYATGIPPRSRYVRQTVLPSVKFAQ